MLRSLMLDSGAFSVWTKGVEIDFEKYVEFCSRFPLVPFVVNLDVIPGKPREPRSLTPRAVDEACNLSWTNYQYMISRLPKERVVPVFHQGDNPKWLEQYLSEGPWLLGISPANDRTVPQRLEWLRRVVKPRVVGARVRMHGFAVTSFRLITSWPWWSVDSVSWVLYAAYGCVVAPVKRGVEFDYSREPVVVNTSSVPPLLGKRNGLFAGCSGSKGTGKMLCSFPATMQSDFCEYIDQLGLKNGQSEIVKVPEGYKLQKRKEVWASRDRLTISRIVEPGVANSTVQRSWANLCFYQRSAAALGIKIFLGLQPPLCNRVMSDVEHPLFSYHGINGSEKAMKVFERFYGGLGGRDVDAG